MTPWRVEISQGQDSESACEEMISLVGTLWGLYVLCGKYFCYPFARGGKNKTKTPSLAGILSHTIWEENVAKVQAHFPTVWSLNLVLRDSRIYSIPRSGALPPWSSHYEGVNTDSREDPEWMHMTLPWTVSPLTRHPRAPHPELLEDNPGGVCLMSTMGMQSSIYLHGNGKLNKMEG